MSAAAQDHPQKGVSVGKMEQLRDRAEATRDDALTRRELESMSQARGVTSQLMTDIFLALDANGNGRLERSELPPQLRVLRADFGHYDRDRDMRLSYSEFADFMDVAPPETVQDLKALTSRQASSETEVSARRPSTPGKRSKPSTGKPGAN
ncbi:hypothetical protein ASG87_06855 [Frateuria sp. Soil773]|nr:hypothetical protein ASG87_06855 [Frateuria sp. Soil773]